MHLELAQRQVYGSVHFLIDVSDSLTRAGPQNWRATVPEPLRDIQVVAARRLQLAAAEQVY